MGQVIAEHAGLVWLLCGVLLCSATWIVLHLQYCLKAMSQIEALRDAAVGVSVRLDSYEALMRDAEQRSFELSLKTGHNPSTLLFDVRRKMNSVRDLLNEIGGALDSEDEYAISLASDALDTLIVPVAGSMLCPWEEQLQALIEKVMHDIDEHTVDEQVQGGKKNSKINQAA